MKNIIAVCKKAWMYFARTLGKVNTVILLSLVYVIVIGIMAVISRIFRKDLLHMKIRSAQKSFWQPRPVQAQTLDRHKYQF
jgi:hypothetical protein